jgi:hypothetical protein
MNFFFENLLGRRTAAATPSLPGTPHRLLLLPSAASPSPLSGDFLLASDDKGRTLLDNHRCRGVPHHISFNKAPPPSASPPHGTTSPSPCSDLSHSYFQGDIFIAPLRMNINEI